MSGRIAASQGPRTAAPTILRSTFGAAGPSVKLVVLNACNTEQQAEALLLRVRCVPGYGTYRGANPA